MKPVAMTLPAERRGFTLLIVDDKPQNLRLISDFLAERGFELMLTRSGAQALGKIELARLGKLVRVEQIALELEQRDARYGPFGRRLYALARGFEEERLVAILEDCIDASRDEVSG